MILPGSGAKSGAAGKPSQPSLRHDIGLNAFSAPALPAGQYEVRGQMTGFRQIVREAEVLTGSTTTVPLQMAGGAVTEEVTVAAAAAHIAY